MRISTNNDDPWKIKYANCYEVYYKGMKIDNCIMADEQLGLVERYAIRIDGSYVIKDDYIDSYYSIGSVKIKVSYSCFLKTYLENFYYRWFHFNQSKNGIIRFVLTGSRI